MSTFYHVTKEKNVDDIMANGFLPLAQEENNRYIRNKNTLSGTNICGVFFFLEIYDAEGFLCDNNGNMDLVILKIDTDLNYILDPEYDGEAVFVPTAQRLVCPVNIIDH